MSGVSVARSPGASLTLPSKVQGDPTPMLLSSDELHGYTLHATDGLVGHVKDLFVDDTNWSVRHLVVETGNWLASRRVLIPSAALLEHDAVESAIRVSITREQVRHSPDVDTDMPVSRQHETDLSGYYGFPTWHEDARPCHHDRHLWSVRELDGYRVRSPEGDVGTVREIVIDDDGWRVVALGVKSGRERVRVAADRIESVSWDDNSVSISSAEDVELEASLDER